MGQIKNRRENRGSLLDKQKGEYSVQFTYRAENSLPNIGTSKGTLSSLRMKCVSGKCPRGSAKGREKNRTLSVFSSRQTFFKCLKEGEKKKQTISAPFSPHPLTTKFRQIRSLSHSSLALLFLDDGTRCDAMPRLYLA